MFFKYLYWTLYGSLVTGLHTFDPIYSAHTVGNVLCPPNFLIGGANFVACCEESDYFTEGYGPDGNLILACCSSQLGTAVCTGTAPTMLDWSLTAVVGGVGSTLVPITGAANAVATTTSITTEQSTTPAMPTATDTPAANTPASTTIPAKSTSGSDGANTNNNGNTNVNNINVGSNSARRANGKMSNVFIWGEVFVVVRILLEV